MQFLSNLISTANAILNCVGPSAVGYLHEITFSICSLLETSCTNAKEKFLQPAVACYNNSCIGTREMCEWGTENQYHTQTSADLNKILSTYTPTRRPTLTLPLEYFVMIWCRKMREVNAKRWLTCVDKCCLIPGTSSSLINSSSGCRLPEPWKGKWFQSGVQSPLEIKARSMETKGICYESSGDKFLFVEQ